MCYNLYLIILKLMIKNVCLFLMILAFALSQIPGAVTSYDINTQSINTVTLGVSVNSLNSNDVSQ